MKRILLLLFSFPFFAVAQSFDRVIEYYYIGSRYYGECQYDSALYYFEKVRFELDEERNGISIDGANIRTHIANTYCRLSQFSKAIDCGIDALKIYEQLVGNNSFEYANGLKNMAWYYESAKQYNKSIEYCQDACDSYLSIGGNTADSLYVCSVSKLAHLYYLYEDIRSSVKYYKRSLLLEKKLYGEESPEYALSLNNLAAAYSKMQIYDTAAILYEKSAKIRKIILGEEHDLYRATIHNIIMVYYKLGNKCFNIGRYAEAIEAYLNEARYTTYYNDSISHCACLNDLSTCYWLIGDYDNSMTYGIKLSNYAKKIFGDESVEYAKALVPLVHHFTYLGYYKVALEVETIAREINKRNRVKDRSLDSYSALLQEVMGDAKNSIKLQILTLKKYVKKNGAHGQAYGALLDNLACSYYKTKNFNKALKYEKKSLKHRLNELGRLHPDYVSSLFNLAIVYYSMGAYEKSLPLFMEFYSIESERTLSQYSVMTSLERSIYSYFQNFYMRHMISLSGRVKNSQELNKAIYNSILLTKGLLMNCDIIVRNLVYQHNDSIIQTYEILNDVKSDLLLNKRYDYSEIQYSKLFDLCNELEREVLKNIQGEYQRMLDSINISYDDFAKSLDYNKVAIEFCYEQNEKEYYAVIAKKEESAPIIINIGTSKVIDSIWSSQIRYGDKSSVLGYNVIWKPVEPYINEGDSLWIATDGLLHQVNIETLADSMGKMAGEKYVLHRVSSTRQICNNTKTIPYSSIALFGGLVYDMDTAELVAQSLRYNSDNTMTSRGVLGYDIERSGWKYLPGTKEEIEIISGLMRNKRVDVSAYIGKEGTEEAFKSLSGKHTPIIHIATHGFYYDEEHSKEKVFFSELDWERKALKDNSMQRSGLILSGGQNAWLGNDIPENVDDGILLAEEIASMDLSGTDLVVLSACETGLGDITSDGVFGLQRAFKMAGVQTLVMSLWKVDDNATSLMMQTFYEHLLSGKSKRESFKLAQAAVRAKYQEPYYWAGFIMLD